MSSSVLVRTGVLTSLALVLLLRSPGEGGAGFQPARQEAGSKPAPRPRADKLVAGARTVLAAVVGAARKNARLPARGAAGARPPFRLTGDELTAYYVRAAAAAARRLPAEEAGPSFLLALGVALDDSSLLRTNPVTGRLWEKVEGDKARRERLKVLGLPTVHGRHDLAQHFAVSAALTGVSGAKVAEAAGVLKEVLDSGEGGSGFSFADLSADLAGIAFARRVLRSPGALARVARSFAVAEYALPPRGLPEGLSHREFERRYGSVADKRFRDEVERLRRRVRALPGYRE